MSELSHADAMQVSAASDRDSLTPTLCRIFAWSMVGLLLAFLLNNYLNFWRGWPGAGALFESGVTALGLIQIALYLLAVVLAVAYVLRTPTALLRPDSARIYRINAFIVRAAFWAVLLIGLTDAAISFLRVEGFLPDIVGERLAIDLGRPSFRGTWIHFPMVLIGILIATYHRGLGFPWLALLVVCAELVIVITRFIYSYEQAYMADLVRFWYGALFLFASAYTLFEEGHVRVDVLYAGFTDRTKGIVDAVCSILLGLSLCWVIVIFGMNSGSSIINSPLLSFEVTPTGFGMYVKYWMAGFLALFAITMLIQFSGYFLESVANYRDEPGKRLLETGVAHEHYET